jgi:hypothetical protein
MNDNSGKPSTGAIPQRSKPISSALALIAEEDSDMYLV